MPFDVAADDVELAKQCFRILRRSCARHHVGFSYYEDCRRGKRVEYMLVFDARPPSLGLAAADFALEMHAVALLQNERRRKQLPLRLLYWVTYSGSEEPLRLQTTSNRVPAGKRDQVIKHLEEYALAWGSWRRGELPPADYLEAQHSLITNLAIDLVPEVDTHTPYPQLVKALRVPEGSEGDCLNLGRDRNRVKHRGRRHEAARYAEQYEQTVYSVALALTGIDAMPRSAYMSHWEIDPAAARRPAPMFSRHGDAKRFTRY